MTIPCVLSIAGSDSGGGAGIQADLKAFARSGVHGMTAITAITAQNTVEVRAVEAVSPGMIKAQIAAVADDLGVDAVKIGMLGSVATIEAVAEALGRLPAGTPIVLDPVMVAESGGRLLDVDAEESLRERIVPLVTVVTPNVAESRVLARAGEDVPLEEVARRIHALGPGAVIVTGGHREEASDLLFDGERFESIPGERHPGGAAHGSGCTHSATLAAQLAKGRSLMEAATAAREIAGAAVRDGLREVGAGAGPVNVLGLRS
ncbi:bifunctional hydroxymethylpyrimidine kinase/phosphomethylpyrimidine kinase [Capillimicrobium parvum]|uniref:Pyridoxine kinase n=1 Tax=Capillimicrobium parvum TaxID=2884022 RepID=A0A9E6XWQ8_9ACTN|nr:bifunctional hydroxymethylpyrimidine kinase/phosphomethylpyrimidine kinase [Capillimicrobium parvum]UGS35859.1 Pyridoxine kinase [Capillimicrobium parvum]